MPELPSETSWTEDQEAQRKGHSAERHMRFKGAVSSNLQRGTLATDQTPNTSTDDEKSFAPKLTFLERLQYFKWNWFTVVMATGGVADILHSLSFRFRGLETIGKAFMIFNIVLFLLCCTLIILRFNIHHGSFRKSFLEPSESLFIPASVISVGIILMTIAQYGIPETGRWLQITFKVLFWIYAALAFLSSCCIYLILWSTQEFSLRTMTPIWVFPVYPLLITTPLATSLINALPSPTETLHLSSPTILACALCLQFIGFLVSTLTYSALLSRLMTQGLPAPPNLPSMFVSVGPAAFTSTGLLQLGTLASTALPHTRTSLGRSETVAIIIRVLASATGLSLWALALWLFVLSLGALLRPLFHPSARPHFNISFFAFVFPNAALVISTLAVGKAFAWQSVQILGCVGAVLVVGGWVVVFGVMGWGVGRVWLVCEEGERERERERER